MAVRILVVDDESDVEVLFRQQFRRELRDGRFNLTFAQVEPAHARHVDVGEDEVASRPRIGSFAGPRRRIARFRSRTGATGAGETIRATASLASFSRSACRT